VLLRRKTRKSVVIVLRRKPENNGFSFLNFGNQGKVVLTERNSHKYQRPGANAKHEHNQLIVYNRK
jgi:hypothetical protein